MLAEFGVIHDVFRTSSYCSPEVCDLHLLNLKRVLMERGIVRDLQGGGWRTFFKEHDGCWDLRAKELVKKLVQQRRLQPAPPASPTPPATDFEWCREALASSQTRPLVGIIASRDTAAEFAESPLVSGIQNLNQAAWWHDNQQSVYIPRHTAEYLKILKLVLEKANLLMFIDPHLDPSRDQYSRFIEILLAACRSDGCSPKIEIHRVCYQGRERRIRQLTDWRASFESLDAPLRSANLGATVFIWDDFHDRFLISDLIGILMSNGFDDSRAKDSVTTWARISREVRARLQQEFDPTNSPSHKLHGQFELGR